jgi:hypothetical protein
MEYPMHNKIFNKAVVTSLTLIMLFELSACGTIFYPERKGTRSGELDPIVVAADAVGLLFFFIPGVVAFAVDFSNGTIYKGGGRHSSLTPEELKSVTHDGKLDKKLLSELISKKLGQSVDLEASNVQVQRIDSEAALLARFNAAGLNLASL